MKTASRSIVETVKYRKSEYGYRTTDVRMCVFRLATLATSRSWPHRPANQHLDTNGASRKMKEAFAMQPLPVEQDPQKDGAPTPRRDWIPSRAAICPNNDRYCRFPVSGRQTPTTTSVKHHQSADYAPPSSRSDLHKNPLLRCGQSILNTYVFVRGQFFGDLSI